MSGKTGLSFLNLLFLLLFFQLSSCSDDKRDLSFLNSITEVPDDGKIPGPSGLLLKEPAFSPGNDPTPTIEVSGFKIPKNRTTGSMALYADRFCLNKVFEKKIGSNDLARDKIDLTIGPLEDGNYSFYAKTLNNEGDESQCSTLRVDYVLETQRPPTPNRIILEQPKIIPALLPETFRALPIGSDPTPVIKVSPVGRRIRGESLQR